MQRPAYHAVHMLPRRSSPPPYRDMQVRPSDPARISQTSHADPHQSSFPPHYEFSPLSFSSLHIFRPETQGPNWQDLACRIVMRHGKLQLARQLRGCARKVPWPPVR
jgi:hypothetical protein